MNEYFGVSIYIFLSLNTEYKFIENDLMCNRIWNKLLPNTKSASSLSLHTFALCTNSNFSAEVIGLMNDIQLDYPILPMESFESIQKTSKISNSKHNAVFANKSR